VPSSTPNSDEPDEDREKRKGRARAIREQIEGLRRGISSPPSNPREFVNRPRKVSDRQADAADADESDEG
jgi:hypothetical protein